MATLPAKRRDPHPVVEALLGSHALFHEVLVRQATPDSPVLQAILCVLEHIEGLRTFSEARKAAEAAPLESAEHPDLVLLFLATWAYASIRNNRPADAQALLNRARALGGSSTPAHLRSYLLEIEAYLAGREGNSRRREALFNEAVALMPAGFSTRRWNLIWDRALFLARLGRAAEVDADLSWLEGHNEGDYTKSRVALVRFNDAVHTGRVEEAGRFLEEVEADAALARVSGRTFHNPRLLFDLMVDGNGRREGRARAGAGRGEPSGWVRATKALLRGRTAEALRWARTEALQAGGTPSTGTGFPSYALVRAELSAGKGEAARRLIDAGQARGNAHYLDDFFLARAERLAGNREGAARLMAAALSSFERYRASGLLGFELRLARELRPQDILEFGRAAGGTPVPRGTPPAASAPAGPSAAGGIGRLVGPSAALAEIREAIARYAPLEVSVLITGETGTGKDLAARALHEVGPRRDRPFLAVNCGAISEPLLETELFGHERGAFTGAGRAHRGLFEEAGSGTLFLDEIGEIPPRLQVALLRVLETGEFRPVGSARSRRISCRIVAATNAPLSERAEEGAFRKDLLFRLQRLEVRIPPLRDRRDDILPLARRFLNEGRKGGAPAVFSDRAERALLAWDWPGNVRELRSEIERMRILNSDGLFYDVEHLGERLRGGTGALAVPTGPASPPLEPGVDAFPGIPETTGGSGAQTDPAEGVLPESGTPRRNSPSSFVSNPKTENRNPKSANQDADEARVEAVLREGSTPMRRRDRLRGLFRRHRKFNRTEVAKILGVALHTAASDLKALIAEGLIEKVEPSRSRRTHYFEWRSRESPAP